MTSLPAFVAADYPGPRPDGPVLVRDGEVQRLGRAALDQLLDVADRRGDGAERRGGVRVWRFSVAYGSNASPSRLVQKGLDRDGALLLPAVIRGHVAGFEHRRTGYGAVPLTLLPAPGATTPTWVLGVPVEATDLLDRTEGRVVGVAPTSPGPEEPGGRFAPPGSYQLGRVGPVVVADRWRLDDGLAYLPGPSTRVQVTATGRWRTWPAVDQRSAGWHVDSDGPARPAPPPVDVVEGPWPRTPLTPLA